MMKKSSKDLLIIFTRNPELGKCKTRLAATVGDQAALDIYIFLLDHTVKITSPLQACKRVYYSEAIHSNDRWDPLYFEKHLQEGEDLGERMQKAFEEGWRDGYENICIIGSDMYDITTADLESAFEMLDTHEAVIGPATDGGYYLLGLKRPIPEVFQNKTWGSSTVLEATLRDLSKHSVARLAEKNDVDYYEDIKGIEAFQPFLDHIKSNFNL